MYLNFLKMFIHQILAFLYLFKLIKTGERNTNNKEGIVFFDHFYSQDVDAMAQAFKNKSYNSLIIDTSILFKSAHYYFDYDVRDLNAVYPGSNIFLKFFKVFSLRLFIVLNYFYKFSVLVIPSDNYYWVREFIQICKDNSIKVIVVDKEGLISPYDWDYESIRIKKFAPFISTHLYVWSERQKEYWIKANTDDSKITVIGQPRSDLFFKPAKKLPRKSIIFFTFDDYAYLSGELRKIAGKDFSWKNLKNESLNAIFQFSKNNPNIDVVIKAHPQQSDLKDLQAKYSSANLKVIGGSQSACSLIRESDLVIVFQSTALLESIMIDKNVIYLDWAKSNPEVSKGILQFSDCPGALSCKSLNEFNIYLNNFSEGKLKIPNKNRAETKNFLDLYFYNADGNVSKRLAADITTKFL